MDEEEKTVMKKKKWLMPLLCLAVLLLLLCVYFAMKNQNSEPKGQDEQTDEVKVTDMESGDITSVEFELEGDKVSFTKNEDSWTMDKDTELPLDSTKITSLVSGFSSLTAGKKLSDISDLKEYGLDEPQNYVSLTLKDGSVTTVYVGNKNSTTSNTYVYLNDDKNTVFTVSKDLDALIPDKKMELVKGEEFPTITGSNITDIDIEKGENKITLDSDSEEGKWYVTDGQTQRYSAASDSISTLESAITGLSFEDLVDYKGESLDQYGLQKPSMVIRVQYTETTQSEESSPDGEDSDAASNSYDTSSESSEETTVSKNMILNIGDKNEEGKYYVNLDGSKEVHTVSADSIDSILEMDAKDYWDMGITTITKDQITGLTVEYKNSKKEIEKISTETTDVEEYTKTETTYQCNGEELDTTKFDTFYNKMTNMEAQSKDPTLTSGEKPEMIITFHTEKGDKSITYSSYDENFYLVKDLEGRLGLASKTTVKEFIAAFEALDL